MAVITAVAVDEALAPSQSKEPSARTLRTRQLEHDAAAIADAVERAGAALIEVTREEGPTNRYLTGMRSALQRLGYQHILLQKRRSQDKVAAWAKRPEDEARVEKRRQTGARLGGAAKERAANQARANTRGRRKAN